MTRALAITVAHACLWCAAIIFIALAVNGCAKPSSDYWGAVSRGVGQQLEK